MTRDEALLLSAYTGYLLVPDFSELHEFCEKILGRPIFIHEFVDEKIVEEIREKLKPEIMSMIDNLSEV